MLVLRAAGRVEVRYPILIERDTHWDGCLPGESEPFAVPLPRAGELEPDDVHVPAGYCWVGGDPRAAETLQRRRVWVDGLVMRRFPVTNGEYLEFLNDLVANGREEEALTNCPRAHLGISETAGQLAFSRDHAGRFILSEHNSGPPWQEDWPVVMVSWYEASAYSRWLAGRAERPFRLPDEIEREKAARGADGRFFPWGNHFDATWGCIAESHSSEPARASIQRYPLDVSPYGVRGLGGNSRDWCNNLWTPEGPVLHDGRLHLVAAVSEDSAFRAVRGEPG